MYSFAAMQTGDSTTAFARAQLCGHAVSLIMREHTTMGETLAVHSTLQLCKHGEVSIMGQS